MKSLLERIEDLERLSEKATKGPWQIYELRFSTPTSINTLGSQS